MNTNFYMPMMKTMDKWMLEMEDSRLEKDASEASLETSLFDLWEPLRFVLTKFNGVEKLKTLGEVYFENNGYFLYKTPEMLAKLKANICNYLPEDKDEVRLLSEIFRLNETGANTITMPCAELKEKKNTPPYDTNPSRFLEKCFSDYMDTVNNRIRTGFLKKDHQDETFSMYFASDEALESWIRREHLECFFGSEISRISLIDVEYDYRYEKNRFGYGVPKNLHTCLKECYKLIYKRRMRMVLEDSKKLFKKEPVSLFQTPVTCEQDVLSLDLSDVFVCWKGNPQIFEISGIEKDVITWSEGQIDDIELCGRRNVIFLGLVPERERLSEEWNRGWNINIFDEDFNGRTFYELLKSKNFWLIHPDVADAYGLCS